MDVAVGCHDQKTMKSFLEIDCPKCHTKGGIEVILQEGYSVGESICDECGYELAEHTNIDELK